MENAVKRDVLFGRPYGGVLTLISNSILKHANALLVKERLVIINVCDCIFINVYLPCKDNKAETIDILLEIFSDISNTIDDIDYNSILFGGDLNCNLVNNCDHSRIVKNFLKMYNLEFIDISNFSVNDNAYTFSNVKKGCYTIIDYLCLSSSLVKMSLIMVSLIRQ